MKQARNRLISITLIIEIMVSVLVLAGILYASYFLIIEIKTFQVQMFHMSHFETFLEHALTLVIGLEFIRMLMKHTPYSAIEVLLYAMTRQLVVYHTNALETLLGIFAVACVFAIRKFLYIPVFEDKEPEAAEEKQATGLDTIREFLNKTEPEF